MKKIILLLSIFTIAALGTSCSKSSIEPSAELSTSVKSYSSFDGLELSNAFTAYVKFSNTEEKIEIIANENLHQYIEIEQANSTLHIGLQNNIRLKGNPTLKVYITTKNIKRFDGSGASQFILEDRLTTPNVNIELSGASYFSGSINCAELNIDQSGASNIDINGDTESLNADLSGASMLRDYDFTVTKNLLIDLSGASSAKLTANGNIKVEASGASTFHYKGNATIVSKDLSGSSSIHHHN